MYNQCTTPLDTVRLLPAGTLIWASTSSAQMESSNFGCGSLYSNYKYQFGRRDEWIG